MASLLSGREVPPAGGETEFVSMRHAYATLPAETRRWLDPKIVVHSILYSRSTIAPGLFDPEQEKDLPPVRQALVRANPVNGRTSIYVGSHACTSRACRTTTSRAGAWMSCWRTRPARSACCSTGGGSGTWSCGTTGAFSTAAVRGTPPGIAG